MVKNFSHSIHGKTIIFLNLIPKKSHLPFFLCRILGLGHLRGPGSVLVGFWGARQLSPLGGGGGGSQYPCHNKIAPAPPTQGAG